jgi:lipopolysaccharide assembly protein A
MRRLLVLLILTAAFCLGVALSYYNWTPVRFHYLAGETELPLVGLLLAAFVAGAALIGLLGLGRRWALQLENRRLQKRLQDAEAELKNLRNLPLKDA